MKQADLSVATFAGGCFWCIEAAFEALPGVVQAINGYAGGQEENPTYEQVCSGRTGHQEAVQVHYDSTKVSYKNILDNFFNYIDPTDSGGQYVDRGYQYTTSIFYHDEIQKKDAEAKIHQLSQSAQYQSPIVTTIKPFTNFYPAEDYHQDFYKKSPERYKQYKQGSGRAADL